MKTTRPIGLAAAGLALAAAVIAYADEPASSSAKPATVQARPAAVAPPAPVSASAGDAKPTDDKPKDGAQAPEKSPDEFIPSEDISEDLAVAFPVDI